MAQSVSPVGFGIVGVSFGMNRAEIVKQTPGAKLVAVSSRQEDRAKAAGEKLGCDWTTDYRDMLRRDDIHVIGIYTPSGLHRDIAIEAAEAGKHCIITKPLEVTLERMDAMIAAAEKAKTKIATEYVVRYQPGNYALYRAVHDGRLGKLIIGEFTEKLYRPQWYYERDGGWRAKREIAGGGTVVLQTIHQIDQMMWLMGPVESVTAKTGTYATQIESEDAAIALIRFRSGAMAMVVGTTTFRNDKPPGVYGGGTVRRLELNGDLGAARIDDETMTMLTIEGNPDVPREVDPPAANVFEDFVHWVHDDSYASATLVKAEESRASMEIVLAIYESGRTGKTVTLPLK
jgi:UDP-N-acetyl-2-amino-2-deoxyglucuronate dehydrogenase